VQALGPFGGEVPGDRVARPRFGPQRLLYSDELWVQPGQKLVGRVAAETFMPHGLVPHRAPAPLYVAERPNAGEQGRHPVTVFDHGRSRGHHLRGRPGDMQQLGPEPLRGVDPSLVHREIDLPTVRKIVDLKCLFGRRMVFPEYKHRIWIFCKRREHCERCYILRHQTWRRARRVDGHPPHEGQNICSRFCREFVHHGEQRIDIVLRMLTKLIVRCIAVAPLCPPGILRHGACNFLAVLRVGNYGATRVRAVIDADDIHLFSVVHGDSSTIELNSVQARADPRSIHVQPAKTAPMMFSCEISALSSTLHTLPSCITRTRSDSATISGSSEEAWCCGQQSLLAHSTMHDVRLKTQNFVKYSKGEYA